MSNLRERILNFQQKKAVVTPLNEAPSFSQIAEEYGLKIGEEHEIRCEYEEGCLLALDWALPEYIEEGQAEKHVMGLGSFLGEMIVTKLGGRWEQEGSSWIIELNGTKIYPFQKAQKRLTHGRSESLIYFYQVLKRTIKEEQSKIPQAQNLSSLIGYLPRERPSRRT